MMLALAFSALSQVVELPALSVTLERPALSRPNPPAPDLDVGISAFPDGLINSVTSGLWPDRPDQHSVTAYRPRTALGARLLALRNAYVRSGGELLSLEALDAELRTRRGGISDD